MFWQVFLYLLKFCFEQLLNGFNTFPTIVVSKREKEFLLIHHWYTLYHSPGKILPERYPSEIWPRIRSEVLPGGFLSNTFNPKVFTKKNCQPEHFFSIYNPIGYSVTTEKIPTIFRSWEKINLDPARAFQREKLLPGNIPRKKLTQNQPGEQLEAIGWLIQVYITLFYITPLILYSVVTISLIKLNKKKL